MTCIESGRMQVRSHDSLYIMQVVIGVVDPNPLVGGAGVKTLEAAGISPPRRGVGIKRRLIYLKAARSPLIL